MKKGLRIAAWVGAGLALLVFFTLVKFPQDRLPPLIQSQIDLALAPMGITVTPEKTSIGILFGLSYTMENVKIGSPSLAAPAVIEKIRISPALLGSLMGQVQARIKIQHGDGSARIDLFMRDPAKSPDFEIDATLDALDLGTTQLIKLLTGAQISGQTSGSIVAQGNAEIPSSLEAQVDLKIAKFQLDQQSVMGFALPKISAPQAQIRLNASKGKLQLEQVQIDKGGDLWFTATGQSTLGQRWDVSVPDVKFQFGMTDTTLKSLGFIENLIRIAKQPSGEYAFTIAGTWAAPFVNPVTAQ